jgi:molybdopterin-guanine dinucleotide biosynthesis protein A
VSLLERQLARLGPCASELWLSATPAVAAALAREVCVPQVLDAGEGPARALAAVAEHVRAPWIVWVGGDQPGVSRALVERLVAARRPDSGAVVARVGGFRCPLPGLYRTDAVCALDAAALAGTSLQALLDRLGAVELDGVEPAEVASINTPEDRARAGLS